MKQADSWICVLACSESLGDLCFNIAHWILAMFYLRIAKNMPRVSRGERTKRYNKAFWAGLAFNAFGPILEAVFQNWHYYMLFRGHEIDKKFIVVDVIVSVSEVIVYSAQILSGTILIWSLIKIRKFQLANPATDQEFNLQTMLLHAAAFGLFIVSVAVFTVFVVMAISQPRNKRLYIES